MRRVVFCLTLAGAACASAQVTGPGLPPAQVLDAQRRAELREALARKQAADAHQLQLDLKQRAELREAVRRQQQRPSPRKDAGARP